MFFNEEDLEEEFVPCSSSYFMALINLVHKTLQEAHKDMTKWNESNNPIWCLSKPVVREDLVVPENGRLAIPVTSDGLNSFDVVLFDVNEDVVNILTQGGLIELNGASLTNTEYGYQIKPHR